MPEVEGMVQGKIGPGAKDVGFGCDLHWPIPAVATYHAKNFFFLVVRTLQR